MKALFYVLIILNLAFFAWQYQKQLDGNQPDLINAVPVGSQPPSLVLLSERVQVDDDNVLGEEEPLIEISQKMDMGPDCYQVGPFKKQADLDYAARELQDKGFNIDETRTEKRVLKGWLVYLSEDYSLLMARERMKKLREVGVHDLSVVRSENNNFIISLGFFSNEPIAEERLIEITGLGYEPKVKTHDKHYEVFMLNISHQSGADLRPWELNNLLEDVPGVEYQKIDCQ